MYICRREYIHFPPRNIYFPPRFITSTLRQKTYKGAEKTCWLSIKVLKVSSLRYYMMQEIWQTTLKMLQTLKARGFMHTEKYPR